MPFPSSIEGSLPTQNLDNHNTCNRAEDSNSHKKNVEQSIPCRNLLPPLKQISIGSISPSTLAAGTLDCTTPFAPAACPLAILFQEQPHCLGLQECWLHKVLRFIFFRMKGNQKEIYNPTHSSWIEKGKTTAVTCINNDFTDGRNSIKSGSRDHNVLKTYTPLTGYTLQAPSLNCRKKNIEPYLLLRLLTPKPVPNEG